MAKTKTTNTRTLEAINNLARGKSKRAIEVIGAIMDDESATDAVRLKAAELMLDRAVGKAVNKVEQTVDINVQQQHLIALKDAATIRLNAIEANEQKVKYVEHLDHITIEHEDDTHGLA